MTYQKFYYKEKFIISSLFVKYMWISHLLVLDNDKDMCLISLIVMLLTIIPMLAVNIIANQSNKYKDEWQIKTMKRCVSLKFSMII